MGGFSNVVFVSLFKFLLAVFFVDEEGSPRQNIPTSVSKNDEVFPIARSEMDALLVTAPIFFPHPDTTIVWIFDDRFDPSYAFTTTQVGDA